MRTVYNLPVALACLSIAAAVVVNGTHAKDLAAAAATSWHDTHKTADDTAAAHFIKADLHHHADGTLKVQHQGGDGHQADSRSLRLLNHKRGVHRARLASRFGLRSLVQALVLS